MLAVLLRPALCAPALVQPSSCAALRRPLPCCVVGRSLASWCLHLGSCAVQGCFFGPALLLGCVLAAFLVSASLGPPCAFCALPALPCCAPLLPSLPVLSLARLVGGRAPARQPVFLRLAPCALAPRSLCFCAGVPCSCALLPMLLRWGALLLRRLACLSCLLLPASLCQVPVLSGPW